MSNVISLKDAREVKDKVERIRLPIETYLLHIESLHKDMLNGDIDVQRIVLHYLVLKSAFEWMLDEIPEAKKIYDIMRHIDYEDDDEEDDEE